MRILQVSDSYPPATGGLERAVQTMADDLTARGHVVDVATMAHPGPPGVTREGSATVHRLDGWTRHLSRFSADPGHLFHPTVADPKLVRSLQRLVDTLQPDIVHAHGWVLHSCLALRLPPACALVVTLHDYSLVCAKKTMVHHDDLDTACAGPALRRCLPCAQSFYGALKGTPLTLGLAQARHRWDKVAMFLPISAAVRKACVPEVDPRRVSVIPSFVADDVAAGVHPRPGFVPDGEFLLFVGALGAHKGVEVLLEAHRRMTAPVPLVLIGAPRADTPVLTGTPERPVHVHTGVPHAQIMAAFAAAGAVAVPSRWPEPLGLVAVEAMAAGTPVVVSDVGGLAEIVRDGSTGLVVPPGDSSALAASLDRLLADPVLRARLGTAGRVRAADYMASTVTPMLVEAYERATARVTSRGAA